MTRRTFFGTLLCLLALGCGGDEQERRSAASWSAAAVAVARMWVDGELPSACAGDALKRAAEELRKGPLPRAAAPVEDLREAVERNDRRTAANILRELGGS